MHQPSARTHAGSNPCRPARSQTPPEVCSIPRGGTGKIRRIIRASRCVSHGWGYSPPPDLGQALGAPPVSFGNVVQRRDQAEGVVAVVAAVAQQQAVLFSTAATHQTHDQIHLQRRAATFRIRGKPRGREGGGGGVIRLTGLGRMGGMNFLYRDLNLSASIVGSLNSTGSCFTRIGISFSGRHQKNGSV